MIVNTPNNYNYWIYCCARNHFVTVVTFSEVVFSQMEKSFCTADITPLINRVVITEPQHNDAVNLKISIFCFQNGTFKSLLCHLFIPAAAAAAAGILL